MAIEKVFNNQEIYQCNKCEHVWMKRGNEQPLICPKCKTARWNKPIMIYKNSRKAQS